MFAKKKKRSWGCFVPIFHQNLSLNFFFLLHVQNYVKLPAGIWTGYFRAIPQYHTFDTMFSQCSPLHQFISRKIFNYIYYKFSGALENVS